MTLRPIASLFLVVVLCCVALPSISFTKTQPQLKVGVAAVSLTPFGQHPDWDGTITDSGVWGERFTDANNNGHWDSGEPFEDDPGNTALDADSKGKYDGIYLAGFGNRRLATGKHDDIQARTLVLDYGTTRIAIVAIDLIGYYSDGGYYGIRRIEKLVDPQLGVQEILVASTHNHEGPDSIGLWGHAVTSDGKYPKYLRFVDRQIARSVELAARNLQPARIRFGTTDPQRSPGIAGMQVRNGGRPPRFFDEELRVMQFVSAARNSRNQTIATLINWNTHPESMEDKNTLLTSDFPHAARETVEKKFGGTALYISGAIGAVEIVGDSHNKNNDRIRFDGKDYPLKPDNNRPVFTFERTEAIGRDIGNAAITAIESGEWSRANSLEVRKADFKGTVDNQGYLIVMKLGVLDTMQLPTDGSLPQFSSAIYAIRLGDAQIVTTPGELFPEIFYGVTRHRRTDCPQADNGAPPEPAIREAMTAKYRFMFGLCPDELGYIVPRYDWKREPVDLQKMEVRQARDACHDKGVPSHYHETNSASEQLGPASACITVALLTGKIPNAPACKNIAQHSDYLRNLTEKTRSRGRQR